MPWEHAPKVFGDGHGVSREHEILSAMLKRVSAETGKIDRANAHRVGEILDLLERYARHLIETGEVWEEWT